MRRNEGRVVNTPLVFKRVLFQGRKKSGERTENRRKKSGEKRQRRDGERVGERESGARLVWRKGLSPEIEEKKTMNAGGVEKRID
ncbi:hypothetical protein TNCV_684291 [Trichonephila clavipes]|nr:hypothetical protein TNCV_684291 [Trichonephila clavipes]